VTGVDRHIDTVALCFISELSNCRCLELNDFFRCKWWFSLLQYIQSSQLYPVFSDHVSSWLVLAVEMPCILWVVWLTWLCLCLCGHREAKLDCSTNFLTILRSCSIFHHYRRAVREYMYITSLFVLQFVNTNGVIRMQWHMIWLVQQFPTVTSVQVLHVTCFTKGMILLLHPVLQSPPCLHSVNYFCCSHTANEQYVNSRNIPLSRDDIHIHVSVKMCQLWQAVVSTSTD